MYSKQALAKSVQDYFDSPLIGLENMGKTELENMLKQLEQGLEVPETFSVPTGRKRQPYEEQLSQVFGHASSFSKAPVTLMRQILTEINYTR